MGVKSKPYVFYCGKDFCIKSILRLVRNGGVDDIHACQTNLKSCHCASNVRELTSSRYSYPRSAAGTVSLLDQNVCRPAHVPDMEGSIPPKGREEGVKTCF